MNETQEQAWDMVEHLGFLDDEETPETVPGLVILLAEEVGEVARAIRKAYGTTSRTVRTGEAPPDVRKELADAQIVLAQLATRCGVDLDDAVTKRCKELVERHKRGSHE